jgi:tetratricopeptide (TPR) repeat protein
MSIQRQPENEPTDNERSLQQLAWTLQASVGKFKLIWAQCNYSDLRSRLIERLSEICKIKIQVLQLKESERTLFTAIREELQPDTQALMIVGWESLQDLPQMLTSANQVREEFRKNLSIPIVVWISEEIHHTIMEIAPDLESWGTSRSFAIAQPDLSEFIKQLADEYFSGNLSLSVNRYLTLELELEVAQREIKANSLETEANLASLLGVVKKANSKIDIALEYYKKSRTLWQELNNSEREGKIIGNIAYCYYLKAFKYKDINHLEWQRTQKYVQEYINFITQAQRPELIANFVITFGEILRDLKRWEQLKNLALQALEIHQANNEPLELATDYGFLAQVALAQKNWGEAKQLVEKALEVLSLIPNLETDNPGILYELPGESVISFDLSLYKYLLAQAQYQLGEFQDAIVNLEAARDASNPIEDLQLHLDILSYLQRLYFQKKEYLKAYETKQQQRSIEQQFGLRAFIGAGRLQAVKQIKKPDITSLKVGNQDGIAPEIAASARQLDVERLTERIGRLDYKLIVIHGQSGVGKSSLVNAGLLPALKNKPIGVQDNLVVAIRVYTNWVEELERLLLEALREARGDSGVREQGSNEESVVEVLEMEAQVWPLDSEAQTSHPPLVSPNTLLTQIRENEQHNLRTVLICDQFEEFFFVYTEPQQRRQFFEFLGECLNILSVKVILSLREDYLHYLLEFNRLSSMKIISNDILSNNVLYELGNFSPTDAKLIIQRLTEKTSFYLEPGLVEQVVQDLAGKLAEVRPIELQVVGAQLQTENITTLAKYQEYGHKAKEELVKRYLAEVVDDCGIENKQGAGLLLYLLTDEKGTRPLKTRAELEQNLQALAADITTDGNRLDLVLEIFVKSGLVVLLPEKPFDRYQLVHDYLAAFIRQQQQPKLNELIAQVEQERKQRLLEQEQRLLTEQQLKQSEQAQQILAKANHEATKRIRLGSAVLGISLVLAAIAIYYNLQEILMRAEDSEYRKLEVLAISKASRLDQLIIDIQRVAVQVSTDKDVVGFLAATNPQKQTAFRSSMQQTLDNVFRSNPDYDVVYIIDTKGRCLAATDPTFIAQNYAFREYFRFGIQGRPYVSSIIGDTTSGRAGIYFSNPVRSEGGKIVGVAVLKIKGEDIWAIVNALQAGSQSYAFLVDERGVIISHPDKSLLYHSLVRLPANKQKQSETDRLYGVEQIKSLEIPELAAAIVGAKQTSHTSYYSPIEQTRQMVGFAPLQEQPWVLGVNQAQPQFDAPLNELIWLHGGSVLVVGGITAIIALLARRIY